MATYTTQWGDSPASIAGKLFKDQRWAVEILRLNPDITNWKPNMVIQVPDLEAVQNLQNQGFQPFISNELAQEMAGMGSGQTVNAGTPSVTGVGQPAQGGLSKKQTGTFGTNLPATIPQGTPAGQGQFANMATAPLGSLGGTQGIKPVAKTVSMPGAAELARGNRGAVTATQRPSYQPIVPNIDATQPGALPAQWYIANQPKAGQNVPAGGTSPVTPRTEPQRADVYSGGTYAAKIQTLQQQIVSGNLPQYIQERDVNALLVNEPVADRKSIMEAAGYVFDLTTKTWIMGGQPGLPELTISDGQTAAYQMGVLYHLWDVPYGYSSITASLGGGASQTGRTDLSPATYYAQVGNMIWNTGR